MEKLDKVIAGLECCGENDRCLSCPYMDVGHPNDLDCIKALSGDAVEVIERLKRQLKYARAERDAATARMARLIGQAEAKWLEQEVSK